jgi:hypothetical protein
MPNNDEKKLIKKEMLVASKLRTIEKQNNLINEVKSGTGGSTWKGMHKVDTNLTFIQDISLSSSRSTTVCW